MKKILLATAISSSVLSAGVSAYVPDFTFGSPQYLVPMSDRYKNSKFAYTQSRISRSTIIQRGLSQNPKVEPISESSNLLHTWWLQAESDGTISFEGSSRSYVLCPDNVTTVNCTWEAEDIDGIYFRLKDPTSSQYLTLQDDNSVILSTVANNKSAWKLVDYHQRRTNTLEDNSLQNFISTNPKSPNVPLHKQNDTYGTYNDYQTNNFDWTKTDLPFVRYPDGQPHETLISNAAYEFHSGRYPFSADQADKTTLPDVQPESGWELIKANMGYYMPKEGQAITPVETAPYSIPHIILYNRITGKLRVLAYYDASANIYNSAVIELAHSGENDRVATNLFSPYKSEPINKQGSPTKVTSTVRLHSLDDSQWIFADFEMGYDPCTSCYASALKVTITPVASGELALTGRSLANSVPVRDSNGIVDSNFLTSYLNQGGIDTNVGATTFNTYQALYDEFKDQTDFAKAVYAGGNGWSPRSKEAIALNKISSILGAAASAAGAIPDPGLSAGSAAALGFMGGIASTANFSQGSLLDGITLPPPMPTLVFGELSLRGSVDFEGVIEPTTIEMPGSLNAKDKPEIDRNGAYPTYNEELGVFSLISMPVVTLHPSVSGWEPDDDYKCISTIVQWIDIGPVNACEVEDVYGDLLYTLNPASGWHPEEVDVFVAIETVTNGEVETTSEFVPIEQLSLIHI